MDSFFAKSLMTIGFTVTNSPQSGASITVSQLNQRVGMALEEALPVVQVRGEVSNFTRAASGHWYFTLKDSRASVRCVMFRGRAQSVGFEPAPGAQVELRARVTLYEPRGDYQLQVEGMRRAGVGDLYEAFLQLKAKLEAEGLFDPARKREPVAWPSRLGVVTSLQAAALRDVLSVLRRRAPHVEVVLYPAPVQGADAAARLCQALAAASRRAEVDTLLLVRGGGSIEDLWSFNDEALARAIAASPMPVISGVGHETDFTIADFAADLRAPTPTAAAELACRARVEGVDLVRHLASRLVRQQRRALETQAQRVDRQAARLISPSERLLRQGERLAGLARRVQAAWSQAHARRHTRLATGAHRLDLCVPDTQPGQARLDASVARLHLAGQRLLQSRVTVVNLAAARLRTLDPSQTLARGYAIVRDEHGAIVRDARTLQSDQALMLEFGRGQAQVTVTETRDQEGNDAALV